MSADQLLSKYGYILETDFTNSLDLPSILQGQYVFGQDDGNGGVPLIYAWLPAADIPSFYYLQSVGINDSPTFDGLTVNSLAASGLVFSNSGTLEIYSGDPIPTGSGTSNYIAKWTGSETLGNSSIQDTGSQIQISESTYISTNPANEVSIFNISASTFTSNGTNWLPYSVTNTIPLGPVVISPDVSSAGAADNGDVAILAVSGTTGVAILNSITGVYVAVPTGTYSWTSNYVYGVYIDNPNPFGEDISTDSLGQYQSYSLFLADNWINGGSPATLNSYAISVGGSIQIRGNNTGITSAVDFQVTPAFWIDNYRNIPSSSSTIFGGPISSVILTEDVDSDGSSNYASLYIKPNLSSDPANTYGIYIDSVTSFTGNTIGLFIADQNKYAIQTNGGLVSLGDGLEVIGTGQFDKGILISGGLDAGGGATNLIALTAEGANYGFISNVTSTIWALGYGSTLGSLGTTVLSWNSSGNVGIGATTVVGKVLINPGVVTTVGALASSGLNIDNNSNVNDLSQIGFGYTASGTLTYTTAYIALVETNNTGNGYGDLVFGTRSVNTDTVPTERMRIYSSGAVKIAQTLEVDGVVGLGTSPNSSYGLLINNSSLSGTTQANIHIQSIMTGTSFNIGLDISPALGAVNATSIIGLHIGTASHTSGSLSNNYGIQIEDQSITASTLTAGIYNNITSGSAKYFLYDNGGAKSYFQGNVGVGTTTPNSILNVNQGTLQLTGSSQVVPTGGAGLELFYNGTGGIVQVYDRGGSVFKPLLFGSSYSLFNSPVGIGTASATNAALKLDGTILTGSSQYGIDSDMTYSSAGTDANVAIFTRVNTAASTTVGTVIGVQVYTNTVGGSGGTLGIITTNYGIKVEDQTVGATNYAIATGAGHVYLGDTLEVVGNVGIGLAPLSYIGIIQESTISTNDGGGGSSGIVVANTFNNGGTTSVTELVIAATISGIGVSSYSAINIINPTLVSGGGITVAYGILINDITHGSTNYAIHTGAGTIQFGTLAGSGSAVVVTDASGNLSRGTGGTPVTGSGTNNTMTKWTGSETIGNSSVTDSGTLVEVTVAAQFDGEVGIGAAPNANGVLRVHADTNDNLYVRSYNAISSGPGVFLDSLNDAANALEPFAIRGTTFQVYGATTHNLDVSDSLLHSYVATTIDGTLEDTGTTAIPSLTISSTRDINLDSTNIAYGILLEEAISCTDDTLNYYGVALQSFVSGASLNNGYQLYVNGLGLGDGGSAINHVGIYVDSIENGIDSNYAIFTNQGLVSFGDQLNVVSTSVGGIFANIGDIQFQSAVGGGSNGIYAKTTLGSNGNLNIGASGTSNQLWMLTNGNVGIGTSTAAATLDVQTSGVGVILIASFANTLTTNSSNDSYIELSGNVNGAYRVWQFFNQSGANTFSINYGTTRGTIGSEYVTIANATGDVGINQPSPAYKLDVNGTGHFVGQLLTDAGLKTEAPLVIADNESSYPGSGIVYNYMFRSGGGSGAYPFNTQGAGALVLQGTSSGTYGDIAFAVGNTPSIAMTIVKSAGTNNGVIIGNTIYTNNDNFGLFIVNNLGVVASQANYGIISQATYNGNSQATGIYSQIVVAASLTIGEGIGIHIDSPNLSASGSPSISNNYGLKIENQSGTRIGAGYAISTGTGLVNFGDAITGATTLKLGYTLGVGATPVNYVLAYISNNLGNDSGNGWGIISDPNIVSAMNIVTGIESDIVVNGHSINSYYGLHITSPDMVGGTIGTAIGLYIDDIDVSGVTTAYAISTGTGMVFLGDATTIDGTLATSASLTISSSHTTTGGLECGINISESINLDGGEPGGEYYGIYIQPDFTLTASPVITYAGMFIDVATGDTGIASFSYGLLIGDVTNAGTSDNNFAIQTGLGIVSFGDKVGIGTISPTSLLQINGVEPIIQVIDSTTDGAQLRLLDSGSSGNPNGIQSNGLGMIFFNNGGNSIYINGSQQVGIGQSNPAYRLDVNGTGHFTQNVVIDAPSSGASLTVTSTPGAWAAIFNGNNDPGSSIGVLINAGTNGSDFALAVQSFAEVPLLTVSGSGVVNIPNTLIVNTEIEVAISTPSTSPFTGLLMNASGSGANDLSPSIRFDVGGGGGGAQIYTERLSGAGGRLFINTDNTSGTTTNAITILESQFVGIRTTSPASQLDVNGGIFVRGGSTSSGVNAGSLYWSGNVFYFDGRTSSGYASNIYIGAQHIWECSGAEYMRLSTSGQLGIGTGTPGYTLDVVGTTRISGIVGIGTSPSTNVSLLVTGALTSGTGTQIGIDLEPTFTLSAATTSVYGMYSKVTTTGAFTVGSAYGLIVDSTNKGSSTITTNVGLMIENQTAGSSANYAIYTTGNAFTYLGGNTQIGGTLAAADGFQAVGLRIAGTVIATTYSQGINVSPTMGSSESAVIYGRLVAANSSTITHAYGVQIDTPIPGTSTTITDMYGLFVGDQSHSGITTSYGIYTAGTSDHIRFGILSGSGSGFVAVDNNGVLSWAAGGNTTYLGNGTPNVDATYNAGDGSTPTLDDAVGSNGDVYQDLNTGDWYGKISGTWS